MKNNVISIKKYKASVNKYDAYMHAGAVVDTLDYLEEDVAIREVTKYIKNYYRNSREEEYEL